MNNRDVQTRSDSRVLIVILLSVIVIILLIMFLLNRESKTEKNETVKYDVLLLQNDKALSINDSVLVLIGTSQQFNVLVNNSPNKNIVWTIDNENIANVSNGMVTGLDYGKTRLTATYISAENDKYVASCEIIVAAGNPEIELTDVSFPEGDLFMPVNSTYKLAPLISPSRGFIENKVYSSSDDTVVRVDEDGLVTAIGVGEATITIDVNNGKFTDTLNVYVSDEYTKSELIILPTSFRIEGELRKIKVGETSKLEIITKPENANKSKITWESSDETIVSVNDGMITGIQEGHALITARMVNGIIASIDIEVIGDVIPVTDITIPSTDISLEAGQSQTITPIIFPDDASNKSLSYKTLDSNVATVEPNDTGTSALITAINSGTTTIVINTPDGISKSINVTVTGSGGSNNDDTNTATVKVRINGDSPSKICNGQELKYYDKPKVEINLNNGISKIVYCYGTSICTPNITITASKSFNITQSGLIILRLRKYDASGNEIKSSENGNYYDGAIEYYINTKEKGMTCTRQTPTCASHQHWSSNDNKCVCDAGYTNNTLGMCSPKSCISISTASECISRSDCAWDYVNYCHDK